MNGFVVCDYNLKRAIKMTTNNIQTPMQQNVDLEVLNDFSRPFDEVRLAAFTQVVNFMYAGNP